jgi:predicted nucleic-acid-binding Zn-ribbon protein
MNLNKLLNDLTRKGVSVKCPKCDTSQILQENPVRLMTEKGTTQGLTHDIVATSCPYCGHTDLYVKSILEK